MCLRMWWFERQRTQFPSELKELGIKMVMMTMIKMMMMMISTMTRIMRIIRMMMVMMRLRWMERFLYGFPQNCGKMTLMTLVMMI